ncbi:polysaccharide deacetylase family protein [Ammoniphilus sp. YIM 78166]|uniref:polysaccharide deacetylase family protein n=1 Tax=Ammoniphilus sp. YIM 78166 TaxID=1644106 RepID=UPI00106FCA76|nr:polysaccharide deacetylase family protein [Ammoniphilus sp. YIM 78166]
MRKIVIFCIVFLALGLLLYGSYKLMNARTYQVFGELVYRVETEQKRVALTFDDGPTPNVESLLPLLDQYNAKATFFLIGKELENHLQLGKDIVAAGHQLGNHTYSHNRMVLKSPSFIKDEIEKTNVLIRQAGYHGRINFRPPNGKKLIGLPYYLKGQNMRTVMWDLEPDTYFTSVADKVDYVSTNVKPGSIILLHPMYDSTGNELKVIEGILESLTEKGFEFVTVEELIRQ